MSVVLLYKMLYAVLSIWAAISKYHKLGGSNNRHLFFIALEAGKSKFKAPTDSVSGEGLLPGSQMAIFSLCPYMVGGARELSETSSLKSLSHS